MEGDCMAKSIMIQGTMSNVGKSFLCAGLCRIFHQDGYRVAPFKSQNMALNSYITSEGLEMGRAQVVQAEAAGIAASIRMNPILLKPTGDMGSQVIVNGEVIGNMRASEYFRYKKELIPLILKDYEELSKQNDIIVIEGAGSPAEINLKEDDIVNMGLARMTNSPVLLVGNIDPGGVFAQLIGTLVLLEPAEKERVKGFIINKFRGDPEILAPGLRMLEAKADQKVLGVVPYMDIRLEDEDSLSEVLSHKKINGDIDIAVIRLPRTSNFTDFEALDTDPSVSVRYVSSPKELGNPDVIIIPGTKNTIEDLIWLRQHGLEAKISNVYQKGCILLGICGGYQMLGEWILDPEGLETERGSRIRGMGYLPMTTEFAPQKTRTLVQGRTGSFQGPLAEISKLPVSGYEIHMGRSEALESGKAYSTFAEICGRTHGFDLPRPDGMQKDRVLGTYLHGIFDEGTFRTAFVRMLRKQKGLTPEPLKNSCLDYRAYREQQYDKLADVLRHCLDMEEIYHIMGIKR
jgi:adenosylcobyric acid synthase